MSNPDFYDEPLDQSRVKSQIVSEYFVKYFSIVKHAAKKRGNRVAYLDLLAGPGIYEEGTKSTPLLVLERAIKDEDMQKMLVMIFNDNNNKYAKNLQKVINNFEGVEKFRYKPQVYNYAVDENIITMFNDIRSTPTLFFIDPFGYKVLSLELIGSALQDWGWDCIFFFNYNRIQAALSNNTVLHIINAIFGEKRASDLRNRLKTIPRLSPKESETLILSEFKQALGDVGGEFALPFRFNHESEARTSHYLIFVSKDFTGYEAMKSIMAKYSSTQDQGVASFEYNPSKVGQILLFSPIDDLKEQLLVAFAGEKNLTLHQIYTRHNIDTPYLEKNYRTALEKLENEGKITITSPTKKRIGKSFPETVLISFPK